MSDRKRAITRHIHSGDVFSPASNKRKNIPGPLGMLSKCESSSKNSAKRKSSISSNELVDISFSDHDVSVTDVDVVRDRVMRLFGPESWQIFTDYSIDKIVKNAGKAFPRGKIPVFCASVEKIDTVLPIAKAVLQDETGKIGCSIDKSVIRKYKKFLTIGAVLVLKQISLFSLNHKTFYLNITHSNVTRIFLDEAALDSRLLASARTLEDVTVCGPNFPLTHPPLSLNEVKNLVAECSTPLPPPPSVPSSPPISRPTYPLKSPVVTPRSSSKRPDTSTPTQPKLTPYRQNNPKNGAPVQADQNWRLNTGSKAASAVDSKVSTTSTPNPSFPHRPRFGIRSLLKNTLSTVPATSNSSGLKGIEFAPTNEKSDSHEEEKPTGGDSPADKENMTNVPAESFVWMEDDMDALLASMVE